MSVSPLFLSIYYSRGQAVISEVTEITYGKTGIDCCIVIVIICTIYCYAARVLCWKLGTYQQTSLQHGYITK